MENGELNLKTPVKAVVVFVGTNNVDCTPDDIFQGILKLVETVQMKLGADVHVVLPVKNQKFRSYFYRKRFLDVTS